MKWAIYLLLVLSVLMCWFSDISTLPACILAILGILAAWQCSRMLNHGTLNSLQKNRVKWIVSSVVATVLIGLEIHTGRGEADSWLLRFIIDLIFWLLVYRAFDHDTRPKRMQVVFLSMLPLAAMAYTLDAAVFLTILFAYIVAFMACHAIEAFTIPTSGATAKVARQNASLTNKKQRDFDIPGFTGQFVAMLVIVFLTSFAGFFLLPRLDSHPATVTAASRAQSGTFPDIDLDKTGDIELEPTLLFMADLPVTSGSVYWRIDVQNTFDGKKWRSASFSEKPAPDDEPMTWHHLTFTQNWRDWHLPTVFPTSRLRLTEDNRDAKIRLYTNTSGLWYRWGWKRATLEGFDFAIDHETLQSAVPQPVIKPTPRHHHWPDLRPLWSLAHGHVYVPRQHDEHANNQAQIDRGRIWPYGKHDPFFEPITQLSQSITSAGKTNLDKADAVVDYLQTHQSYSLTRPKRVDPVVADFLFNQTFGHCEVFSSAMVVMLNAVDVPARNVTGFMSSEYHDGLNYVRTKHAHSWVEVFDEQTNTWVRFDPTPPSEAFNEDVSIWVRFNDWFITYKSRDLYSWIPKHIEAITLILSMLAALGASVWGTTALFDRRKRRLPLWLVVLAALVATTFVIDLAATLCIVACVLAGTTVAAVLIARRDTNTAWHHAIEQFRAAAQAKNSPLASMPLEQFWHNTRTSASNAVQIFFDEAIQSLYGNVSPVPDSLLARLSIHWRIRKLLVRALKELNS